MRQLFPAKKRKKNKDFVMFYKRFEILKEFLFISSFQNRSMELK
jgi:tRNA A37 threonylcarbamoyladenosine synthetase subunit TsaC/SUA5/YrdC